MADFDWHDMYEIGIDFIDQEHKTIFFIMQDIRHAVINGNLEEGSKLSSSMIRETENHFAHEEQFLEQVKFPGLNEHKKYHTALLIQANRVKMICEGIVKDHDAMDCLDAMEEFLVDDILGSDFQLKSFLEHEGYIKRQL